MRSVLAFPRGELGGIFVNGSIAIERQIKFYKK